MVASGVALAAAAAWGFLEAAGAPHLPMYAVVMCWFGALGLAGLQRRARR